MESVRLEYVETIDVAKGNDRCDGNGGGSVMMSVSRAACDDVVELRSDVLDSPYEYPRGKIFGFEAAAKDRQNDSEPL